MAAARVDRWIWAVRVVPTRTAATELCRAGHVKVNGSSVKASHLIQPGDRVTARVGERERILEVVEAIDKRVGAPVAARCVIDHSPPPPSREPGSVVAVRERSSGRPTKRERRETDRLRGR